MNAHIERCSAPFFVTRGDLNAVGLVVAFPPQRCVTAAAVAAAGSAGHRRGGRHHVLPHGGNAGGYRGGPARTGRREGTDGGDAIPRDGEEHRQGRSLVVHVLLRSGLKDRSFAGKQSYVRSYRILARQVLAPSQ